MNALLPTLRQLLTRAFALYQVRRALKDVRERAERLPASAELLVFRIIDRITFAIELAPDILSYDPHVDNVRQAVLELLPETLDAYLKLPEKERDNEPVDGLDPPKTARDILIDQLTIIEREVDHACDTLYQDQADELEIQGRYLVEKFGPLREWLPKLQAGSEATGHYELLPPTHSESVAWLIARLEHLQKPRFHTKEFQDWHSDVKAALTRALGPVSGITQAYHRIPWRTSEDPKQAANQEAMFTNSCQIAMDLLHIASEKLSTSGLDKNARDVL